MPDDDLLRRLDRLEARQQIHALLLAYRRTLDEKDFDGYAELFGDDGQFVTDDFVATGRAEIRSMLDDMVPEYLAPVGGDDLHLLCNVEIEVADDDTATASSTWVYLVRGDGDAPQLSKLGHYHDQLRRVDGRWRFARRRAPMMIPAA